MNNCKKEINNENAYFRTVIKNMDVKDSVKQSKIDANEISINEFYDTLSGDFDMDECLSEQNLLGWIELIENPKLHQAVKSLPVEDQIFLSYIIKEQRTQQEMSQLYNIAQQNICKKFHKINAKIKRKMLKK